MIQDTELMINNLVKVASGEPIKITAEILLGISNDSFYKEKTNPIPITNNRLIDLSFIKDNYGVFYKTEDDTNTSNSVIELLIKRCQIKGLGWVWDVCVGGGIDTAVHFAYIKYIHELQNIYYWKTMGKRVLIVKDKS